ncbi:MAG: transposase [Planctomycetaceae bacterium]|nr:transposase [Planctomycetaceae bacterium]
MSIALRHPTIEACLAELRRNESLRKLIDIESEDKVPRKWNLSRFLDRLGEETHLTFLHQIFDAMIQQLGEAVPDLGRDTAGDATALNARRKKAARAEVEEEQGLPQATGGRKEYTDDDGKVNKVVEWFGFKLHLLVDVKHEVSLSYKITDTKAGDGETLPAILDTRRSSQPSDGPHQDARLRQGCRHQRCASTALQGKHHTRDPESFVMEGRPRTHAAWP